MMTDGFGMGLGGGCMWLFWILFAVPAVWILHGVFAGRQVATDAEKRLTIVLYDATVLDYRAIESELENTGFPPLDHWWSRFKAGCFQYSDTNARENATARPSACCNKPPK